VNTKRKTLLAGVALAVGLGASACGGAGDNRPGGGDGGDGELEVFSWWTSGSEEAALDVLAGKFEESGSQFVNASVSGGGGSNARQVLATRLQGGDPPDSWQLHPDKDLATAVEDGTVADITGLFEDEGWTDVIPQALLDMLGGNGKYYAVPVNAHRANVLWTNPQILEDNGIAWDASTTADDFMADAQKLSEAGVTPLCLGDKDVFASAQLLETLIMGRVGADGWNKLFDGSLGFDDAEVKQAVADFVALVGYANSDHSALTWDQAAVQVAEGACAANLMGDWAYGELLNKGFKENEDFGYVTMPGTGAIFDFVGDAFVKPAENAPNPDAEDEWLKGLLDPQVQADFNLAKGSTPVRTDVDTSAFPPYQKQAADDFTSTSIVSSLAHFEVAPSEFCQAYLDAVTALTGDGNVDSFTSTMASAQQSSLG
jgi:glucose/mannose transport system substrate-binding protein